MAQQFQITFEDSRFRTHRATFERAQRGAFPKLLKIELLRGNGKDTYWELRRTCMYGLLEEHTKEKLKEMAKVIRYQA